MLINSLITGNLLLQNGFRYFQKGYSLPLPMDKGQFMFHWNADNGLYLCLKDENRNEVPDEDLPQLLHRLDHVKTLESLQQVYEVLTGQQLLKVSDELYEQQVWSRREQDPADLGMEIYREKFDSPVRLMDVFTKEITPEILRKKGFTTRDGRMEARLFCKYDLHYEKDRVLLIWEEGRGLSMEIYQEQKCVGTISLKHIASLKELLEVKSLLTPRPKMSDPEFQKRRNYLKEMGLD